MDDEIKKENRKKTSVLWLLFRNDAKEMNLPARVIEGIKLRLKERFGEKNKNGQ